MAIRPEISLEAGKMFGQQPAGIDLAKQLTGLYTLGNLAQTQQANIEAVKQAQIVTQQKTREEEARKRIAQLGKQFTTTNKAGKVKVDHRAIAEQAASEGMDADIVQKHLTQAIQNEQSGIKTDQDKNELLEKNAKVLDNLLRVQKDSVHAEQILQNQVERDAAIVGPEMASKFYSSRFPINTDPIKQAQINFQTTVGIPEEQQMKIEAAAAEREAAKSFATPEDQNPNSKQSVKMRETLIAQGFEVAPNASAFDIMNNPLYSEQVKSQMPGVSQRIAAVEKASDIDFAVGTIREGVAAAEKVKGIQPPTKLGTFLKSKIDTAIKEHPELGVLKNAISAHNKQYPDSPINIETDNLETIINTLKSVEGRLEKKGKKELGIATQPSIKKALEGGKETPAPEGTVKIMRLSDGKIKAVPAAQAERFTKIGQFKIVGK